MRITLITGGVRCGKSHFAQERAHAAGRDDVTFIATAAATDDEMERRIAKHRAERPSAWCTVEATEAVGDAIADAPTHVVLLDCLTLLVSNAILATHGSGEVAALDATNRELESLLNAAGTRAGELFVVSNEVGWGVVPEHPLGRWFRDAAGSANQRVARAAQEVVLMVAGIPMRVR